MSQTDMPIPEFKPKQGDIIFFIHEDFKIKKYQFIGTNPINPLFTVWASTQHDPVTLSFHKEEIASGRCYLELKAAKSAFKNMLQKEIEKLERNGY